MAPLDWSQCGAVESVPRRLGGAWVFRNMRMPVSTVFDNLEAGANIDEIIEQFDLTREQINAALELPLEVSWATGNWTRSSAGKRRHERLLHRA